MRKPNRLVSVPVILGVVALSVLPMNPAVGQEKSLYERLGGYEAEKYQSGLQRHRWSL